MTALPSRYEAVRSLGRGGGGEVWHVRDRVTGRDLALKILAHDAQEAELSALVREASALSGLLGIGLPAIDSFGALADGRRYLVRELVSGTSLEAVLGEKGGPAWLAPFASACVQLASIHRAGFFHGDIKPANIIVTGETDASLVDLGLIAPWRDGGTLARGLTPAYAAPELREGGTLTVRSEVYALGVTLRDGLAARAGELDRGVVSALEAVAARAAAKDPSDRFPSVAEFESAVRVAAKLPPAEMAFEPAWPIIDANTMSALTLLADGLGPSGIVVVVGPSGAGKTSLLRRVSWALGVRGRGILRVEPAAATNTSALEREIVAARKDGRSLLLVDDLASLDSRAREELARSIQAGASAVLVGTPELVRPLGANVCLFEVPPLAPRDAEVLVQGAVPSLPAAVVRDVVARAEGRPGPLRKLVREIARHAIVSSADLSELLDRSSPLLHVITEESPGSSSHRIPAAPLSSPPPSEEVAVAAAERAFAMGRIAEADALARGDASFTSKSVTVRFGVLRARIALAQGDLEKADAALRSVQDLSEGSGQQRAFQVASGRLLLRRGEYEEARRVTLLACEPNDTLSADGLSVVGVAWAFTGDEAKARATLERAVSVAELSVDDRAVAIAYGSLAIADAYFGRTDEARANYERSLEAASRARDAATVATTHLNLAALVQGAGDLSEALRHLEAAVDMARRAGVASTLQQALLNLANLDLYLGRYSRANVSLSALEAEGGHLSGAARAQLMSLRAERTVRTSDFAHGAKLYEEATASWLLLGRRVEAAESALEGLLAETRVASASPAPLGEKWAAVQATHGAFGFAEHAPLAALVRGSVARLLGDEETAKAAFDEAVALAKKAARPEWTWQALDERARLGLSQGGTVLARKDTEAAIEILEAVAARLPRDLREVFWDDPRRKSLRQNYATMGSFHGLAPGGDTAHRVGGGGASTVFSSPLPEDRLARVLEMTRELAREHDLGRLLTRITDHAIALVGAERGFVLLADGGGSLHAEAARDRRGDDPHVSFSRSVTEKVIQNGEPVVTVSARDDVRLAAAVSVHQLMIQSIACVPIRSIEGRDFGERKAIGALYVETRLRPGVRFSEELPTLGAFADQAAIAIENARLITENRKRAEELLVANQELSAARDRLSELLGKKTEQLAVTRKHLERARQELGGHFGYGPMIGTSEPMRRLYALIERVKGTDVSVLVTGESGTGKELVARAIHDGSGRAKGSFVAVNCGAIPQNLLESELFGAVRGAFTGADKTRLGLVREADGGTLLLDEVGELPAPMQSALLRVLQEKTVRPVGGDADVLVNVRVIASTHRRLEEMVRAGTFREDLYYRLHVVEVTVPPLRERVPDIAPLVAHFLSMFAARHKRESKVLSRAALRKLCAYSWPGNVRQLEHVLLSSWLMSDEAEIEEGDIELPDAEGAPAAAKGKGGKKLPASLSEQKATEREKILEALAKHNWNRARAAEELGVPRRTFYRRLQEFEILGGD